MDYPLMCLFGPYHGKLVTIRGRRLSFPRLLEPGEEPTILYKGTDEEYVCSYAEDFYTVSDVLVEMNGSFLRHRALLWQDADIEQHKDYATRLLGLLFAAQGL